MRLCVRFCVYFLTLYFLVWRVLGFVAHCDMNPNICVYTIEGRAVFTLAASFTPHTLTEQAQATV